MLKVNQKVKLTLVKDMPAIPVQFSYSSTATLPVPSIFITQHLAKVLQFISGLGLVKRDEFPQAGPYRTQPPTERRNV